MSFSTLTYILAALQGPFNQLGITNDTFLNKVLPNNTFKGLNPRLDLPFQCSNFTSQLDQQLYNNFNSCVAIANATYDVARTRAGGRTLNDTLLHNLALVGINGDRESKAVADIVVTEASDVIMFFCRVTRCDKVGGEGDSAEGRCTRANLLPDRGSGGTLQRMSDRYASLCREHICDRVSERASNDPDVGGIGVFISYFQQVVIALMILGNVVAHNLPHEWMSRLGGRAPGRRPSRQNSFLSSSRWHKSSEEFIEFGFNFHKSQMWFLYVIIIASYIRRAKEDVSLINSYMLLNIALNGVGLLSFTLLMLALLKRDNVDCFVMYMTVISYILCLSFMCYILTTSGTEAEDWIHAATFCSERIQHIPRERWDIIVAYIDSNKRIGRVFYVIAMVFCTIVTFCTVLLVRLRFNLQRYYDNGHKTIALAVGGITLTAYFLVFFMQLWLMALFTKLASVIWEDQWGFGQIIAVTVWVPVITDYFWAKFQKKKDYLRHLEPPRWASQMAFMQISTAKNTVQRSNSTKRWRKGPMRRTVLLLPATVCSGESMGR